MKKVKLTKYFYTLLTLLILLSAIFLCMFIKFSQNKTEAATTNVKICDLNYIGSSYSMYSNLYFICDGNLSNGDVVYTNTQSFSLMWKKTSTNFNPAHNMSISNVTICVYSNNYANGLVPIKIYDSAPKYATRLEEEKVYENAAIPEGKYRISWSMTFESFGSSMSPSGEKTVIVDRTAPTGSFVGATNGEFISSDANVFFYWQSAEATQAPITATKNGSSYASGVRITPDGAQNIVLSDAAGNSNAYSLSFIFDIQRPFLSNIQSVQSAFGLSDIEANKLKDGQVGNLEIDIGVSVPGVEFSFVDNSTAPIEINIVHTAYVYTLSSGVRSVGAQSTFTASGRVKLDKPGEYKLITKDKFNNTLTINFVLKIDVNFNMIDFVQKNSKYILGNESVPNILAIVGKCDNAYIQIDDLKGLSILTTQSLKECLSSKPSRSKEARIKVVSSLNGIETVYFDSIVCLDFEGADIHNLASLIFGGGNGMYLGTTNLPFSIDFGGRNAEIEECAELYKTLYDYDSRNILYVKAEERIDYLPNTLIDQNGYYVLKISDGFRTTEYSFRLLREYKSANDYSISNEYFVSPQYNVVKLPMSFGNFNIVSDNNIDNAYVGAFSAEKKYLFNSKLQTAYTFAFAAEFSVCVQKIANGYLYRAKNQGIQVAYNDVSQLRTKINEVIKEYVIYNSMKLNDNNYIDYASTIIMDNEIKQNGRFENVGAQIVSGIEYNKIMLICKDFVFRFNNGNDAQSINGKIEMTNLETLQVYSISNGACFGDISGQNGLYKIEEFFSGSAMSVVYYVFLDNVAPTARVSSAKASGTVIEQSISAADTIALQIKDFNLMSVYDVIDNFCLAYISGYGFSDSIAIVKGVDSNIKISSDLGHKGAYEIEVFDRSKNRFKFTIYIMGQAPTASISKVGSGNTEHVVLDISASDKFCQIVSLKIYKNQTSTNIGEIVSDDSGQSISFAVYSYVFKKGGRYKVVMIDNFERETIVELRYIKDMPSISAEGLNKERRVNKDIRITIPLSCLFVIFAEKNSVFSYEIINDTSAGKRIITIKPRNDYNELVDIDDKITIKAWFEADPDAYNDLSYYLDTIAPSLKLTNEKNEESAGVLFKYSIKLKFDADVKAIDVMRNGKYFNYNLGQTINLDGQYSAVATDIAGNIVVREFVIDMLVDFIIAYENDKKYNSSIERGVVVAQGFLITANEQLNVVAKKDGYIFEYMIVDKIATAGLYEITLIDNAGNSISLKMRVLSGIEGIGIYNEDKSLMTYNSITNQSIYLQWQELSYIKSVEYKFNSAIALEYAKGELLVKSGAYTIVFTDCVGNILEIKCVIDKVVSIEIKFDKSAKLDDIGTFEHMLTLRFLITVNESELTLALKKDNVSLNYIDGTWVASNGKYEIVAEDAVGNKYKKYITVIGESMPTIKIISKSGIELQDNSVLNEMFVMSWNADNFIAKVTLNDIVIDSGANASKDSRYSISIVDKLGREVIVTITIKSKIVYSIKFSGEYNTEENGNQLTLTRGFSFSSDDNLENVAMFNGVIFTLSSFRNYSVAGDYVLTLKDIANNTKVLRIRVVGQAFLPNLFKTSGAEIFDGDTINTSFYLTKSQYVYSVKVNDMAYESGNIALNGRNRIDVIDAIGYKTTLFITIDTIVSYDVTYGKTFDKLSSILTDKFLIAPSEELTILILLNGQKIEYLNKYYTASGIYEIQLVDILGNSAMQIIEVDNREPFISVKNINGEDILSSVTNQTIFFSWLSSDNILEVNINGVSIKSGAKFDLDGDYVIKITTLLGKTCNTKITINHKISYDLYVKDNKSYEYIKDSRSYILVVGFSISGNQVSSVDCIFNDRVVVFEKDKLYVASGSYVLTITDSAGNQALVNIEVSSKAISSCVMIDNIKKYDDTITNKDFSILQNEFVQKTTIDGIIYPGTIIQNEGRYYIEYTDCLARKSSQIVQIDKSIDLRFDYAKIKNIGGVNTYLNTVLALEPKETLSIEIELNGKIVQNEDVTKPITQSGLYAIKVFDNVGNMLTFDFLVDNEIPTIKTKRNIDNSISVSISDRVSIEIALYLESEMLSEKAQNFILNKNGKYTIVAIDELKNKNTIFVDVDMLVDLKYNFLSGQSINFKPQFELDEIMTYELYFENKLLKEYKINDALIEKGCYTIKFKDEQNNALELVFMYHGATNVLPTTQYHLPSIEGLTYKVLLESQPLDIVANDGVLTLDKTGKYEVIFNVAGKETSYYLEILNTPPKISISGKFVNKNELKVYGTVSINANNYKLYFNGAETTSVSEVKKIGKYKVVATDEVGNIKELEFEIVYRLNSWSWLLIILVVATVMSLILLILKRKGILRIKIKNKVRKEKKWKD